MAEIEIVKKKPIWPWVLLGIIILAILYFLFFRDGDVVSDDGTDDTIEMTTENTVDNEALMLSETAASKIADYTTYVDKDPDMGIDHDYANTSLNKLIDAVEALANTLDVDIKADLETARSNAASITTDPYALDHADKIKNAGGIITRALKTVQTEKFPDMDQRSSDLQNALDAMAPETQTLEQKATMKTFFQQAGELLTQMKNR